MSEFVCRECGQSKNEGDRVFAGTPWCRPCVDKESDRSNREDVVGGGGLIKSRPPKYMLEPDDYSTFGY